MTNRLRSHLAYFACDVCSNDVPTTPQFAKVHERMIRIRSEYLESFRIDAGGSRCAASGDSMVVVIDGREESAQG
jgi:hypothetical protein